MAAAAVLVAGGGGGVVCLVGSSWLELHISWTDAFKNREKVTHVKKGHLRITIFKTYLLYFIPSLF